MLFSTNVAWCPGDRLLLGRAPLGVEDSLFPCLAGDSGISPGRSEKSCGSKSRSLDLLSWGCASGQLDCVIPIPSAAMESISLAVLDRVVAP